MPSRTNRGALRQLASLLEEVSDLAAERVSTGDVPVSIASRGWAGFLLALDDGTVARAERDGLAGVNGACSGAPASLVCLCERIAEAIDVPRVEELLHVVEPGLGSRWGWRVPGAKMAQIGALLAWMSPVATAARRVVDVGAGHGHLTRAVSETVGVETLGLDDDDRRVHRARELAGEGGPRYEMRDGRRDLPAGAGDLLLGLHACGALGDSMVAQAARTGADVLLVGCCPQKIVGAHRAALSATGRASGLRIGRERLGLANAGVTAHGTTDRAMSRRRDRHALRLLLRGRGVQVTVGEESRHVSRHRFGRGLARVAEGALRGRGLPPASPSEIARIEREAARQFERIRRLSLPRRMLGRALEVALALDRASALEEAGYRVEVREVFDARVSPRNIGILGWAPRHRNV